MPRVAALPSPPNYVNASIPKDFILSLKEPKKLSYYEILLGKSISYDESFFGSLS